MSRKTESMIYTKQSQVIFKIGHIEYNITECLPELLTELAKLKNRG